MLGPGHFYPTLSVAVFATKLPTGMAKTLSGLHHGLKLPCAVLPLTAYVSQPFGPPRPGKPGTAHPSICEARVLVLEFMNSKEMQPLGDTMEGAGVF